VIGDPERTQNLTASIHASRLVWQTNGQLGDWYVEPPLSSPLTAALSGVLWDSLPPATAVAVSTRDTTNAMVALTARVVRPRPLVVTLKTASATRVDTLRFDAARRAELLLPPGIYQYALSGGSERGVVAVEEYSDEWRPREPTIGPQPGEATARLASVGLRDRWWLFVIAIAARTTESRSEQHTCELHSRRAHVDRIMPEAKNANHTTS